MILTSSKLDAQALATIVEEVSDAAYGGNLKVQAETLSARRTRFTLKVKNSRAQGAHRSGSGRRTVSACWHAHRDVMHALFYVDASARIASGMAKYEGFDSFRSIFARTYYRNVGSLHSPQSYGALCDCAADDRDLPSIPRNVRPSFSS